MPCKHCGEPHSHCVWQVPPMPKNKRPKDWTNIVMEATQFLSLTCFCTYCGNDRSDVLKTINGTPEEQAEQLFDAITKTISCNQCNQTQPDFILGQGRECYLKLGDIFGVTI